MYVLFIFLFVFTSGGFMLALIKPSMIKLKSRKQAGYFALPAILFFIIAIVTTPASSPESSANPAPAAQSVDVVNEQDKASAMKELDEVINLAKKAQLVTSYEFSETATVVYIDKVWYTQTVGFKKDFMAKIATLKKRITGYAYFEVRDAYSNEKVAEVTAFSSSLEVYK